MSSAVVDSTQLTPAERCMILLLPALGQEHVLADAGAPTWLRVIVEQASRLPLCATLLAKCVSVLS